MIKCDIKLLDYIKEYCSKGQIPMHMPGHKRAITAAPYLDAMGAEYDLTEINGMDDLHAPTGILLSAQNRCSSLWGSKRSYFLVNGSTCGILAGIRSCTQPGDRVIVARNCHKSVYHALELCGLSPVFIATPIINGTDINGSVTPESVKQALDANKSARLVVITSPTYQGVISNVSEIAKIAHSYGVPLMVDEAHGAHLNLSPYFSCGAVKSNADIVVQSLHKTLPSFTQTAVAHINGNLVDLNNFEHQLDIFETSSPSYLLMSSIDECVSLIASNGEQLFSDWYNNLKYFAEKTSSLQYLNIFMGKEKNNESVFAYDNSKIVINTNNTNISGNDLATILRDKYKIELEMAYNSYAIAYTGLLDSKENIMALANALVDIDATLSPCKSASTAVTLPPIPPHKLSVSEALCHSGEVLPIDKAINRISCEYIWAYPPGIPLIIPGEAVTQQIANAIKTLQSKGINVISTSGMLDTGITVVK